MPSNVVKTKADEKKWEKAKQLAEEQGHKEEYDYIMGIYKKMKPDHFKGKKAMRVWDNKKETPAGQKYPKSKWDKVTDTKRPFGWSTPAEDMSGEFPEPWRVSYADKALDWVKSLTKDTDVYTDYKSQDSRGRQQIWVGLRDNRDKDNHRQRIVELFQAIKKKGVPAKLSRDQSYILLVDDLPKGVLRSGRMASRYDDSLRQRVIKLAHDNPELRVHLLPLLKED